MPDPTVLGRAFGRRRFIQIGGVSAAGLVLAACGGEDEEGGTAQTQTQQAEEDQGKAVVLDFSTIFGVLNYAYALEQLEAAYYTQVNEPLYSGAEDDERQVLQDLQAHEVAHREFFKAKLGDKAIGALEPDFSMVDFGDRQSVLETAQTFENLGVGAYNGAASLIDPDNPLGAMPLQAAGDIVSVEARHASAIASLIDPEGDAFAPDAFDNALKPSEVLQAADPFIKTPIRAQGL